MQRYAVTYDRNDAPCIVLAATAEEAAEQAANGGASCPRADDGDVLYVRREDDDVWVPFACESVTRIDVYPQED